MKTKTLLASIAVASMVAAQPVAAATRSADSLPVTGVQSTQAVERAGSIDGESEEFLRGRPLLLIVLLAGVIAALIVLASDGKSPG